MVCNIESYNWGISILRVIMCFAVILEHFWVIETTPTGILGVFNWLRKIAVPVFMMLSFMLMYDRFKLYDYKDLFIRLRKLFAPLVFWAYIYWVCYKFLDVLYSTHLQNGVREMFLQMITGHCHINESMWFQSVIVVITIFVVPVLFFKHELLMLNLMMVLSYCLQYSEITWHLLMPLQSEFRYPLGRLIECIPFAVLGCLLAKFRIVEKCKKYSFDFAVSIVLLLAIFYKYRFFFNIEGFGYQGIEKSILSILFVCLFSILPLNLSKVKMNCEFTNYTLGIYCMHRLIANILEVCIYSKFDIHVENFVDCVIIYIICFFVSHFIAIIMPNYSKYIV